MERNNEAISVEEEHRAFISSLPLELGFAPLRLRLFQGIWSNEGAVPGIINAQRFFRPRPTDILLVSYPKCGTTWLKALAFTTMIRDRHSLDVSHPLHTLNPNECMPSLEWHAADLDKLAEINSTHDHEPRLLSTHLPLDLLPDSVRTSSSCRLVYICRDPKDAVVSWWHFNGKTWAREQVASEPVSLSKMFEMFCQGICPYGSIWDHALGYWNEKSRAPERVMFLTYEELLEDPVGKLLRLAEFMGCPFSEEEMATRVPEEIISFCRLDNLRDLSIKHNREMGMTEINKLDAFYRKGVAGDWRNYLSPEMGETLDRIIREKLQGTGLSLGRFGSETK